MRRASPVAAALAALLVAMVSIQFGASRATALFPLVGASGTTGLRLGMAALILVVAFRPWRRPMPRGSFAALAVYGASLGAMNLLFYSALQTIPLGVAVALEFVGPLGLTMRHARRPQDAVWIGLILAGLWLLLPLGGRLRGIDPAGGAYALAAGGCWATYIVAGKRTGALLGMRAVALGTVVAALLIVPIGLMHAGTALFAPDVLWRGLIVALFSSAIPYSLEMIGLTRLSSRVFGTLMSLEPAVAALIGLVLLGERLSLPQWAGIAAVIAAAAGTALAAPRQLDGTTRLGD